MKTVKGLLEQSTDQYLALLTYRATPFPWCGLSPAELLMGRRLKTDVPQVRQLLVPNWPHLEGFEEKDKQLKLQQKENYDRRHRVRPLPPLLEDTPVWVNTQGRQTPGRVVTTAATPRSYIVDTSTGHVRRNRQHIVPNPQNTEPDDTPTATTVDRRVTRSQAGVRLQPPDRLMY